MDTLSTTAVGLPVRFHQTKFIQKQYFLLTISKTYYSATSMLILGLFSKFNSYPVDWRVSNRGGKLLAAPSNKLFIRRASRLRHPIIVMTSFMSGMYPYILKCKSYFCMNKNIDYLKSRYSYLFLKSMIFREHYSVF